MTYSKETTNFARNIIISYSQFDKLSGKYCLNISDIPNFDLHKLSALIMRANYEASYESTGPDNELFEKDMMPSLLNFMMDTTDMVSKEEFISSWKSGVSKYFSSSIENALEDELNNYNQDIGLFNKEGSICAA